MKRINQKGIAHNMVLAGIAILVLAVSGFAGFRIYNAKKLDAHAASWPAIVEDPGYSMYIYACKTASTGPYKNPVTGKTEVQPIWIVKTRMKNGSSYSIKNYQTTTVEKITLPKVNETVAPKSTGVVQIMTVPRSTPGFIGYKLTPVASPPRASFDVGGYPVSGIKTGC